MMSRNTHPPPAVIAEPIAARNPPVYIGCGTYRYDPDVTSAWPSFTATVWLQFVPKCCRPHTKKAMPATHKMTQQYLQQHSPARSSEAENRQVRKRERGDNRE
jgi:hypothetical protein